jgi:hypothetical protein
VEHPNIQFLPKYKRPENLKKEKPPIDVATLIRIRKTVQISI